MAQDTLQEQDMPEVRTGLLTTEDYEQVPLGDDKPGYQDIHAVRWLDGWTGLTCSNSDVEIAKALTENYWLVSEFGTVNEQRNASTGERIAGLKVVVNAELFQRRDGKLLVGGEPLLARTVVHERYWRDRAAKKLKAATNMASGTGKSDAADPRDDFTRVVRENPGAHEPDQNARPMTYGGKRKLSKEVDQ